MGGKSAAAPSKTPFAACKEMPGGIIMWKNMLEKKDGHYVYIRTV